MLETIPCNRCVTELTLLGRSKNQAHRDGDMVATVEHDTSDCIRHLADVINQLFKGASPAGHRTNTGR